MSLNFDVTDATWLQRVKRFGYDRPEDFLARDELVSPSRPGRKSRGRDFPYSRYCRYVTGDVDR
jgi:hypothetical protein